MTMEDTIRTKLEKALSPVFLQVENRSHLHAGHAGDDGSGETHFAIEIAAPAFAGKGRLACHRMVHETLENELKTRIHALSIKIREC